MDKEDKTRVALWRVGVLGPLVSAELSHGDLARILEESSQRTWEQPDGTRVTLSPRTIEGWHYQYKDGGLAALEPAGRSDVGCSRAIDPEVARLIVRLKRHRPRLSIRRIIRALERAQKVAPGQLKKSTVWRLLKARGLSKRPRRVHLDRRAFRHPHAGDLWMEDVMHGPLVIAPDGRLRKSYLHAYMDSAVRFVVAAAFRLGEKAVDNEAVLKQGLLKHGKPRVLYLDQGAAQTAQSLAIICAELGIRLLHCQPYDPEAKGAIERFFRTFREEVLDELGEDPVELDKLNALLWSWLSVEYHRRVHGGTKRVPMEHWLEEAHRLRSVPRPEELDRIFLHRACRKVRKDGTLQLQGRRLEVRPELAGAKVELRFDPEARHLLPQVYVDGEFYCDTVELDLVRNSRRKRRRGKAAVVTARADRTDDDIDPLALIQDEHDRRTPSPRAHIERAQTAGSDAGKE